MKSDLHIHTIYSDGTSSINDIIDVINQEKPEIIALTDHDTIDGFNEIMNRVDEITADTIIVSGVEITTTFYYNDKLKSVHVLGYGFDPNNAQFIDFLQKNNNVRTNSLKKAIDQLNKEGRIKLNYDNIALLNNEINGLHLTHVFKTLFEEEISYNSVENFKKLLKFEKMEYCSIEVAIAEIQNAGGKAILAHPNRTCHGDIEMLYELLKFNFDGIETYYPDHSLEDILNYLRMAKNKNMIITGGTDSHGTYSPDYWAKIGEVGLSDGYTFIKKLERKGGHSR